MANTNKQPAHKVGGEGGGGGRKPAPERFPNGRSWILTPRQIFLKRKYHKVRIPMTNPYHYLKIGFRFEITKRKLPNGKSQNIGLFWAAFQKNPQNSRAKQTVVHYPSTTQRTGGETTLAPLECSFSRFLGVADSIISTQNMNLSLRRKKKQSFPCGL